MLGQRPEKYPINTMIKAHEVINQFLDNIEDINQYQVAGSFRRMKEMSKDLDYIISTEEPTKYNKLCLSFQILKNKLLLDKRKFH